MDPTPVRSGARRCCQIAAVALLVVCCGLIPVADGQTLYRWTDEKGVLHLSDSAPPKGTKFERQRLSPAAARVASKAEAKQAASKPESENGNESKRPARVVIKDKHVRQEGPSAREFSGTVENVGDVPAQGVYVGIRVTDTGQGDECVREDIDVNPSELSPGETGTFAAWFDNPCFLGEAKVDLTPGWQAKD